jgi:hypothetical protein
MTPPIAKTCASCKRTFTLLDNEIFGQPMVICVCGADICTACYPRHAATHAAPLLDIAGRKIYVPKKPFRLAVKRGLGPTQTSFAFPSEK